MKKAALFLCISAILAVSGCSDKNKNNENIPETTEAPVTEAVTETVTETETEYEPETVPPRKKVEESDYFGKWIPIKIINGEDVYEDSYMDIDIEYLFQLEINEDGTAVMGHAIPENEKNTYNWLFISGMIQMTGESECAVYGSMPYETLILTDGDGLKIYMEHTDKFEELSESRYEIAQEYNGDIEIPELSVEKTEVSPSDYVGKWECNFFETDGIIYKDNMMDIPLDALFKMEITSDGKADFIVGGNDEDAVINNYTWEIYTNGCAGLYEDDECIGIIRIKKDELYFDESSSVSHFRKVDEFSDFDWNLLKEE